MKSGFAKTYRKVLLSDVWKMPPLYHRVFQYLILKASFEPDMFPTKRKYNINLLPGQLITSMSVIAQGVSWTEYGVEKIPNKKIIKDILDWLKFNEMIILVSNASGTYVEVVNWRTYHSFSSEKVTQKKRNVDTLKELKELKEVKKKNKTFTSDSVEFRLSKLLFNEIKNNNPEHKEPNLQTWATHIDRMIRVDNRDPQKIANMIAWVQANSFWRSNVLSTYKLRDQYDQLAIKMKESSSNQNEDWGDGQ